MEAPWKPLRRASCDLHSPLQPERNYDTQPRQAHSQMAAWPTQLPVRMIFGPLWTAVDVHDRPGASLEHCLRIEDVQQLDQICCQPSPAGLVAGPQPGAIVAVEILIEQDKATKGPGFATFHWQSGYCAFAISQSHVKSVVDYIRNQARHHRKMTFQDGYRRRLERYQVLFDKRYVWD